MLTPATYPQYKHLIEAWAEGKLDYLTGYGEWLPYEVHQEGFPCFFGGEPEEYRCRPSPPKLQLREGGNYRCKNGKETGPLIGPEIPGHDRFLWSTCLLSWFRADGSRLGSATGSADEYNIVAEITPETKPKCREWTYDEIPVGAEVSFPYNGQTRRDLIITNHGCFWNTPGAKWKWPHEPDTAWRVCRVEE